MRQFSTILPTIVVTAAFLFAGCGDGGTVTTDEGADVMDTVNGTGTDTVTTDDGTDTMTDSGTDTTDETTAQDKGPDGEVEPDAVLYENGAYARIIDSESDLIQGPMAAGAIGDIILANKHVRFIIRDQEIGLYSPSAGSIVDADLVREDGDEGHEKFLELFPMVGFGRVLMADSVEIVDDGAWSGTAVVRVSGKDHGMPIIDMLVATFPFQLQATMDYILGPDDNHVRIELTVTNDASYEQEVEAGIVVQLGRRLEYFHHRCGQDKGCLVGRKDVEWMAAVADDVTYSFTSSPDTTPEVVLAEEQLLLTRTAKSSLAPGDSISSTQYLAVGQGAGGDIAYDVKNIRGMDNLRTVTGKITAGEAISKAGDAHVFIREKGASGKLGWVTTARADVDGNVTLLLPDGLYDITVTMPGAADTTTSISVAEMDDNTFNVTTNPAGRLVVTINDGDGNLLPAGVVIKNGLDMPASAGGEFNAVKGGADTFMLVPGEYTVMAMKGLEYGISSANATIQPGETTHLLFTLQREVETPGRITACTHAHGENSIDSYISMPDRVHNALAVGLEFPMVTDHDFFSNLQPFIETEGMENLLKSTVGIEVSPLGFHTVGINCDNAPDYPTYFAVGFGEYDENGYQTTQYTPGQIVEIIRGYGCQYVGAAHPWEGSAMFNYIGMGPGDNPADFTDMLDVAALDGFELINADDNWGDLDSLHLPAWFTLLNYGHLITAVGGSDEHGYNMKYGHPMNLVESSTDDPAQLNPDEIAEGLIAGRSILFGGPYIDLDMNGFGIGDLVDVSADVTSNTIPAIEITVDAPSWMTVEFLKVYANGELVMDTEITPDLAADGHLAQVQYLPEITTDTWIVVVAASQQESSRMPGYGRFPLSIANPIYLDADGDGWEAPLVD